jgi:predicted HAD superfamily Cof-like phosphohydrolase
MSTNWSKDINDMHCKYGFHDWMKTQIANGNTELLRKYLAFRITMLDEEMNEIRSAALVQDNSEEVVDGLIDLIVFAIGTLDIMGVDANAAWDAVFEANMNKDVGVKAGRPNRFGMPDLIKKSGWVPPSHEGNYGHLEKLFPKSG